MVITEKLHPETGTSALSNSQELRSRDQFLFGVGEECWCERWSSWVSEENAMVTSTFIIVSATVGIVTIAMVIRKSFHALCTGRRQQVTAAPINAPLSALPAHGPCLCNLLLGIPGKAEITVFRIMISGLLSVPWRGS